MTVNITVRMPDKCDYKGRITFWERDKPGADWRESVASPERYLDHGAKEDFAIWDTRGITISDHYGPLPA